MNLLTANRMILTDKSEIGRALSLYDKFLFWEYSDQETPLLGAELVVPRVICYGTLNEIIRLFVIFPPDSSYDVVNRDADSILKKRLF